ncbi:MAG: hypothetical protein J6B75_04485 [Ruminococcus sp.]|nr:hypothetical protein [Ruminococcus sp.]
MAVIEESLEVIKVLQQTIEALTTKLEQTNAKLAELEEQLHKDSRPPQKLKSHLKRWRRSGRIK